MLEGRLELRSEGTKSVFEQAKEVTRSGSGKDEMTESIWWNDNDDE